MIAGYFCYCYIYRDQVSYGFKTHKVTYLLEEGFPTFFRSRVTYTRQVLLGVPLWFYCKNHMCVGTRTHKLETHMVETCGCYIGRVSRSNPVHSIRIFHAGPGSRPRPLGHVVGVPGRQRGRHRRHLARPPSHLPLHHDPAPERSGPLRLLLLPGRGGRVDLDGSLERGKRHVQVRQVLAGE